MSNRKRKNSRRTAKPARKSLKGQWGKIGAPPKKTKWPKKPFTYKQLFAKNNLGANGQCSLSLITKVKNGLINPPKGPTNPQGFLYQLASKKQSRGRVGRPIDLFVLKSNFDASKMALRGPKVDVVVAQPVVAPAILAAQPVRLPPNFRPPPILTRAPGLTTSTVVGSTNS